MLIGEKLRALRAQKKMSQGEIEKRTGLLRCYISRVENGHTVPAIETLEKISRALSVPLYQIFYDGEKPPPQHPVKFDDGGWGCSGRAARILSRFRRLLERTPEANRRLLFCIAQKMSEKKPTRPKNAALVAVPRGRRARVVVLPVRRGRRKINLRGSAIRDLR
jgi:transcriptional regulator with XRE-family HTH domain